MKARRGFEAWFPALALAMAGCASIPAVEEGCIPFVDSHVHLNNEAMQVELMGRFCATRAVIFWGYAADNEAMLAAAARHPSLFIPFASISPERRAYRRAWQADDLKLL